MMVAIKKPGIDWVRVEIDKTKAYEFISDSVEGFFQLVPNFYTKAILYCNEEGKIYNLPINFPLLDGDNYPIDFIVGTVIMMGPIDKEGYETELTEDLFQETKRYFNGEE